MNATTANYEPRPNSKPAKALEFFQNNPDETLTADDMAEKFGMQRNQVHSVLRPALDAELLKRDRDDLGEYVYSAGPKMYTTKVQWDASAPVPAAQLAAATVAAASNWPRAPTPTRRGTVAVPLTLADIADLQVSTNVPYPHGRTAPGAKWAPLFAKLQANDQSVAYPLAWHTAVQASVGKENTRLAKAGAAHVFRARKESATTARLWRLAK